MSTKTLRKRIALVAVVALGAGVLATSPANAADNGAAGGANGATAAGVLNIATMPSQTGSAVTTAGGQKSVGLLTNSTTMGSGLTQTATILNSGTIVVYATGVADQGHTFVVTGGTISGSTTTGSAALNGSLNSLTSVLEDAAVVTSVAVKPASGATSMRIEYYQSGAITDPVNAAGSLTAAGNINAGAVSRGTLTGAVTVTIATASASGAYSASESLVNIVADPATAATGVDEDAATIVNSSASVGYVAIALKDAYGVSLDSKGALVIETTNGAGVGYDGDTTPPTPTNTVAVSADATGALVVARPAASANKGFSTTVTIKYNGAVVGSKTFTFLGEVAKVTASSPAIGALSASSTSAFRLAYADDKGNTLYPAIANTSAVSATLNSFVTGLSVGTIGSSTAGLAKGTLTCGSSAGSANVQVQHVNPISGSVVTSNIWKATCAGDAATYTASWDKASYTPGSIATLSINFKDAKGNLANAYSAVSTTANPITITGGPSATAVTAPANLDAASDADGIKQYKFIVGTTEGDFSAVVAVPVVNANGVATNQTASYKVAAASGAVSNADVLKAIVSLIASINKQIAALQKALLKR
jgi:hypothetical protein